MKLKFYLLLPLFLLSYLVSGQDYIDFQDRYQQVSTRLVKSAALKNGKISYEGTGTDVFGDFNHYRIYWCPSYNHVNYPNGGWVIARDEYGGGGCTAEPDHINPSPTAAPPAIGMADWWDTSTGGIHQTTTDGPLKLSGPGLEGPPTLTTNVASNIGLNSVTLGGEVTVWGGKAVTERGVVYGTATNPNTSNSKDPNGSGLGTFSESITGLQSGTTYYVRAYAINGNATGYGPEQTFTTLTPTITASGTSSIANTPFGTASGNGSFTVSGVNMVAGILVTPPAGFEVSTNSGSGFAGSITVGAAGTIANTTVYVRLAATTAVGSYSGNINLTSTGAVSKTSAIGSSTVDKRNITITATDVPKTYGAVLSSGAGSTAYTITSGALQNSNTIASVTITYGSGSAANAAVGNYATVVPSAAVGGNGFTTGNYNITYANGNINVGQKALTISATAANKSYGSVLSDGTGSTAFTSDGLQNGETIGSVTFAYAAGAGNGNSASDAVGTYPGKVSISAATGGTFTASNYSISYVAGNIIVGTKGLTITANSASKVYGTTLTGGAGSTAFTASGLQNGETVGSVTIAYAAGAGNGNTPADAVNTYPGKVTPSAATGGTFSTGNYAITYAEGNIVVTPAALNYTADALSKTYGSANPVLTGSVTGFLNGETQVSATTGTLSFSSTATDASDTGSYPVTGSGLSANSGNYTFSQAAGNATALTVTPATLTYVADAVSRNYAVPNPTFSGSVTGFVLSEMQAGATTGTLVFDSPATTASGVGSYAINGSGLTANNGNYTFTQAAGNATALTIGCITDRLFVKAGGTGDGTTWNTASGDLQQMINQACNGAEIWVAGGIYTPSALPNGEPGSGPLDRRNAFALKKDVKVYGGFAGNETMLTERNLAVFFNTSILSGDLDKNDAGMINNESNAGHVVISAGDVGSAVLDGFIVRGGNNVGAADITVNGVLINYFGAGISVKQSSPLLTNLIVTENNGLYGAGIGIYESSPTVSNTRIFKNKAWYGGAIGNSSSSPTFANILINGNAASLNAGAIFSEFGSVPLLTHVTIASNVTEADGAGNIFNNGGTLKIRNSIIYGNDKDFSSEGTPVLDIKNSLVQGNTDLSNGNINANPEFVSLPSAGLGAGGIYNLSPCSPAVNAGANSDANGISKDIEGNARMQGSAVDMGAYEFASSPNGPDPLANAGETATLEIQPSQSNNFTVDNAACRVVAAVMPDNTGTSVTGLVTAKVWVEGTQQKQYVKRHYEITPSVSAGTATGSVTLYASDAEFSDFNTQNPAPPALLPLSTDNTGDMAAHIANIRIEKRDGVSSDGTGLPGTYSGTITTIDPADENILWNASASRWEITFDVTGFSGFFIKTQSAPLPVRWVSVEARLNSEKQPVITWQVEETSVASYSVQKSVNGRSFDLLTNLEGKGDGMHQYSVTENDVLNGTAYYRIRQTDFDGTVTFSRIVSVSSKNPVEVLIVYPLPAKNEVLIDVKHKSEPGYSVSLTDMTGRILKHLPLREGINKFDINGLNAGIYLLKTSQGQVYKMVKE